MSKFSDHKIFNLPAGATEEQVTDSYNILKEKYTAAGDEMSQARLRKLESTYNKAVSLFAAEKIPGAFILPVPSEQAVSYLSMELQSPEEAIALYRSRVINGAGPGISRACREYASNTSGLRGIFGSVVVTGERRDAMKVIKNITDRRKDLDLIGELENIGNEIGHLSCGVPGADPESIKLSIYMLRERVTACDKELDVAYNILAGRQPTDRQQDALKVKQETSNVVGLVNLKNG